MKAPKLSPMLQALAGALTVVVLFSGAWGTAWGASFLGVLVKDGNGQLQGGLQYSLSMSDAVAKVLGPDATARYSQYCFVAPDGGLPRRVDAPPRCALVRMPVNTPACPLFEKLGNCTAIAIREGLLEVPEVREYIQNVREWCTYDRHSGQTYQWALVIGCEPPGPDYTLLHRERTTLCVRVLSNTAESHVVDRFAVRNGRRTQHYWCERFTN